MKVLFIILGIYLIIQPLLLAWRYKYVKTDNLEFFGGFSLAGIPLGIIIIGCAVFG